MSCGLALSFSAVLSIQQREKYMLTLPGLSAAALRSALPGALGSRRVLRILFHCHCASRPAPKAQHADGTFLRAERGDALRCHPGALRDPERALLPGRGQTGKGTELGGGTGRWSAAIACTGGGARAAVHENVFRIFQNACAATRRRSEVRDAAGRLGLRCRAACSWPCGVALHTAPPPARTPPPAAAGAVRGAPSLLPARGRPARQGLRRRRRSARRDTEPEPRTWC